MIRKLQFQTNVLGENIDMVPTEYSVLGYYDGLAIEAVPEGASYERLGFGRGKKELYNSLDIIGLRQESDEAFWRKGREPYIFITCLRFKKKAPKIKEIIGKIESKYKTAVCYLTVDSSDLVVCLRSRSYLEGYRCVAQYYKLIEPLILGNEVQASFSAVAIWQEVLDGLACRDVSDKAKAERAQIKREKLSVLLRANVRDWEMFAEYLSKLKKETGKCKPKTGGILGSEDAIIVLKGIESLDFLKLFAWKGLLTHNNTLYKEALFNVQTEIMDRYLFERKE